MMKRRVLAGVLPTRKYVAYLRSSIAVNGSILTAHESVTKPDFMPKIQPANVTSLTDII